MIILKRNPNQEEFNFNNMNYLGTIWIFILVSSTILTSPGVAQVLESTDRANSNSDRDTLTVARATWDTGWFQTEVFRLLIQQMGYAVAEAQTMTTDQFYEKSAKGEVDFWVNGWFPLHKAVMSTYNKGNQIMPVGYEVKRGALQGYLIDATTAKKYNINSLEQLKNPEFAGLFDTNDNGKADLIGCNADWSCYKRIESHLKNLGLKQTVEQISGDYNPLAREAIERMKTGKPLLLYTWTPNWTLGELEPGRDALWLNVSTTGEYQSQQQINGLKGAAVNPINLGFSLNDIRCVANKKFLQEHPEIKKLFEVVQIPLSDIQQQNAKMAAGKGSLQDIRTHAKEWVKDHNMEIRQKLVEAGVSNPFPGDSQRSSSPVSAIHIGEQNGKTIRVVTQVIEPLVVYEDREYSGFSIEIFKAIADKANINYSIYSVNSIAKMLDDLKRGQADVATAALGITSHRESRLEFTHPYYETGLQIMIPKQASFIHTIPATVLSIVFSKEVLMIFLFFFGVLLVSAHIIWFAERHKNNDFPDDYWNGIGTAIWWAAVTVTTVGYGDKTPKGVPGRVFGLIWIFAGYFAFSYFTATVTSTVTLQEIDREISELDDLYGKKVATITNSAAEFYLEENGINARTFNNVNAAVENLLHDSTAALVYDAPVLQHYASEDNYENVEITGTKFKEQTYGFALPKGSPMRKKLNLGYLRLVESGRYEEIENRWFGKKQ